jgi:hypothetical protein
VQSAEPLAEEPQRQYQEPCEDVVERDLPGVDAAFGIADVERDEETDVRQPVLDDYVVVARIPTAPSTA